MSLKRKLTQDDLRKAMTEHKKKLGIVKKIDTPLAKYNDLGQLMCILCKAVVRSETVWTAHVNSKTHRENLVLAKKTKLEGDNFTKPAVPVLKRPSSPPKEATQNKKVKGILKNTAPQPSQALPNDFFDNQNKQNGILPPPVPKTGQPLESSEETTDNKESKTQEAQAEKEKGNDGSQTVLPEGFFDDPILDAKVRNVEYKDPIEEEWEKFQKEIREETAQSAQIIADDQEEATTERQLDEIEEQIRHWSRVMDLVKRKEEVQSADRRNENMEDDASSDDNAEFDEFLDWRAKKSYK